MDIAAGIDALVARMKVASWSERDAIKDELLAFCEANPGTATIEHLEAIRKDLPLELRWEVDEVVEAITPKAPPPAAEPPPPPPAEEPPPPPDGKLRMSDLKEVYADPRGLTLFTDKPGKRWFAHQVDPYTGQPVFMEIPPEQIEGVKAQLRGSPYWRIGSGVVP